jgi:hypothetical protein
VEHFRELRDEGLGNFTTPDGIQHVPENVVYIVRPQLPLMSLIANQIKLAEKIGEITVQPFAYLTDLVYLLFVA